MRIRSIPILFVWWLLCVAPANAEDYKLVIGEGVDVCDACKRNLERMTKHPACEREYSAELGLKAPNWKPFDVSEHLGAMKQVLKYLATGNEFAKDDYVMGKEQYEAQLRASLAKGEQWVYLAQVDIDNDGRSDHVLRMAGGPCNRRGEGGSGAYSAPIVVLKEDLSGLDRTRTDLVIQNPYRKFRLPGETNYQMYGAFTYNGKAYFDRWNDVGREDERQRFTLSVYQAKGGKTRKLCQLKEVFDQQGVTP